MDYCKYQLTIKCDSLDSIVAKNPLDYNAKPTIEVTVSEVTNLQDLIEYLEENGALEEYLREGRRWK